MSLIITTLIIWGGSFLAAWLIVAVRNMWKSGDRTPATVVVAGFIALLILAV